MKRYILSFCMLLSLQVNAQEFIRADNIFDLMNQVPPKDFNDKRRHEAISDSLAAIIMKSDTIQVLSYLNPIIKTYDEVILSNGMYYEWGNREGIWIVSDDELSKIDYTLESSWASDLRRILAGDIIYTDSIPWDIETPFICYLDRFIMILPGLYEHTRYGYAERPFEIYYGPLDRK